MQRRFVRARLLKSEPCTPQFAAAMIKRMLKEVRNCGGNALCIGVSLAFRGVAPSDDAGGGGLGGGAGTSARGSPHALAAVHLLQNESLSHTDVSNLERAAVALAELDALKGAAGAVGSSSPRATPAKAPAAPTEGAPQAAALTTPEAKPMPERTTDASAKKSKSGSRKKRKGADGPAAEAAATPAAGSAPDKPDKQAKSTEKKREKKRSKGADGTREPS